MKWSKRKKAILAACIGPGVTVFFMIKFFHIEAIWLFTYFAFIFTLISVLLASTLVEWVEKPRYPVARRIGFKSRLKR